MLESLPKYIDFNSVGDPSLGFITIAETQKNVPFEIKRVYWTYHTPNNVIRGGHAHKELHQLIFAVSGKITFNTETINGEKKEFILDDPKIGLYIPPMIWRDIQFSHNAVLLCLASLKYAELDYIRNYNEFKYTKSQYGLLTKLKFVDVKDSKFICEIRNNPINNIYLSSKKEIKLEEQINWINNNLKTNDKYFIIYNKDDDPTGTISLYNLKNNSAEFGRYICYNSINSLEAVYLLLKYAFEILNLENVYCKTVKENEKVWKQHLKFGFLFKEFEIDSRIDKEMIVQTISKENYLAFNYNWLFSLLNKFNKK